MRNPIFFPFNIRSERFILGVVILIEYLSYIVVLQHDEAHLYVEEHEHSHEHSHKHQHKVRKYFICEWRIISLLQHHHAHDNKHKHQHDHEQSHHHKHQHLTEERGNLFEKQLFYVH